jgi:hypothetical protein
MMAESILSISVVAFSSLAGPLGLKYKASLPIDDDGHSVDEHEECTHDAGRAEEEPDTRIVIGGVVLSCIACVVLVAIVFGEEGISWWATVIALVLASVFSILG